MDATLCHCDRLPVEKTCWYAENAGRRFMACPRGSKGCGYVEYIEPPLCKRSVEVINQLQDEITDLKWSNFFEMDKFRKLQDSKVKEMKRKMIATVFVCVGVLSLLLHNELNNDEDE